MRDVCVGYRIKHGVICKFCVAMKIQVLVKGEYEKISEKEAKDSNYRCDLCNVPLVRERLTSSREPVGDPEEKKPAGYFGTY